MKKINSMTKVYGVIGHPVKHSISPAIHNFAFEYADINAVYLCFDVPPERLGEAVRGFKAIGLAGFNVTIPHKQDIMNYLDEVDESARLIGAVNTVVNDNGRLRGYNTDSSGFINAIKKRGLRVDEAIVLGSGGASRAICTALALNGVGRINILNRTYDNAASLANHIRSLAADCCVCADALDNIKNYRGQLLVNTTSVGMWPRVDECPVDIIPTGVHTVYDIVYNPHETKLIRMAKQKGCGVIYGIEMLVGQAIESLKIWTGVDVPENIITSFLEKEGIPLKMSNSIHNVTEE
ncbi:shikimate dehydrogenase [Caldanaerobius polysaccharolyticus]|uniref:shikimate dehydrogenase n=1 Tax=Caldanaerobius polysaccharolyticus TaxID=44256 RepID=UPI0009FCEF59|nr:shikimate dehydrogenase [Caldanaerobius polysaccharolyticus]